MTTAAVKGSLPTSSKGVNLAFHVSSSESNSDHRKQRSSLASSVLTQQQQHQEQQSSNSNINSHDDGHDTIVMVGTAGVGSAGAPKNKIPDISKIPDSVDDSVDSALLAALRDPRERLGLLKLEHLLGEFLATNDPYWDVGGPYNSRIVSPTSGLLSANSSDTRPQTTFQRCLLHRLADRFHLTREPGMDGLIRLYKTPETQPPKRLLLDVDASEYQLSQTMEKQLTISNTNPKTSKSSSNPRKMKIMKRNSSNVSNASDHSKSTPRKGKKDHNDKEKAYAEARARIFKDELDSAPAPPLAPAPRRTTPPSSSNNYINPTNNNYINPTNNNYVIPTNNNYVIPTLQEQQASMDQELSPHDSRPSSKATWRNRRQEVNDPDFQRGGSMVVPQSYDNYYSPTPTTTTSVAASVNANPYYGASAANAAAASVPQDYYGGGGAAYYPNTTNNNAAAAPTHTAGRTGGRGRAGRGGFYPTTHQYQTSTNNYRRSYSGGDSPANLHSLEEFPSLR